MKNELQKHRILIICQSSQDRKSVSLSNFMYLGTWVYYSCSIMKINLVSKVKFNCNSICPYSFIILYIVILHYKSTALWCHTMCKITNHFKALSYTVNYISLWLMNLANRKQLQKMYCTNLLPMAINSCGSGTSLCPIEKYCSCKISQKAALCQSHKILSPQILYCCLPYS